jgi:hypothetical protein
MIARSKVRKVCEGIKMAIMLRDTRRDRLQKNETCGSNRNDETKHLRASASVYSSCSNVRQGTLYD